jgi:hypothetical protein
VKQPFDLLQSFKEHDCNRNTTTRKQNEKAPNKNTYFWRRTNKAADNDKQMGTR